MSSSDSVTLADSSKALNSSSKLLPQERKQLAIDAIAGVSTITKLANDTDISRKFIYAQKEKAEEALNNAFMEQEDDKETVLFYIPVTKAWLTQIDISFGFERHYIRGLKKMELRLWSCAQCDACDRL